MRRARFSEHGYSAQPDVYQVEEKVKDLHGTAIQKRPLP